MSSLQEGNIKLIIIGIVLLGLVGGGYFYYQSQQIQAPTEAIEANLTTDTETIMKDDGETEEDATSSEENSVMAMVMNDENSLTGQLKDVSGGNSNGTTYLLRKNGVIYHYVEANLPIPDTNSVYEGWLVSKTPSLKFFSTGVMEQVNDIFTLIYTAESENLGFNDVVITLETVVDATPEEHILEGTVK